MGTITIVIKVISRYYLSVKPKDFKLESFEKGKPFLQGSLFYAPKVPSDLDWTSYFKNDFPLVIEYCSGNGSWIVDKALKEPLKNFIAVERRFDRVRKIISKITNNHLQNLMVVWGEALFFTKNYVKEGAFSEVYINFPDPWPKRRHEKHRLINEEFVFELKRVLQNEGEIILATDDEPYAKSSDILFRQKFNAHFVAIEDYGTSFFESLWREKGRSIFYLKVTK